MKDAQIRVLLKDSELQRYISDSDSRVVDELSLPVARARIDIAVINGFLHGYEIKGASDTLNRLPSQLEAYQKVFDYVTVVTEDTHLEKVKKDIPSWVGISICSESSGISIYRKGLKNEAKQPFFVAQLLWKQEILDILIQERIPFKKSTRVWGLCELLAANLEIEQLSQLVREKLKVRINWKID